MWSVNIFVPPIALQLWVREVGCESVITDKEDMYTETVSEEMAYIVRKKDKAI